MLLLVTLVGTSGSYGSSGSNPIVDPVSSEFFGTHMFSKILSVLCKQEIHEVAELHS